MKKNVNIPQQVLVDTGGWVALRNKDDQYHHAALDFWHLSKKSRFYTHRLIISETYEHIRRHSGRKAALHFLALLDELQKASKLIILDLQTTDWGEVDQILATHSELGLSYCDASSVVACRQQRVFSIFGFDSHFLSFAIVLYPQVSLK